MFSRIRFSFFLLILSLSLGCDRGSVPNLVGRPAPDFTVEDGSTRISLHQLRGKIVVLNFWATWCPPCVEEMPSLLAMQKQMKDRVTVLAISTDDSDNEYRRFVQEYGLSPTLLTVRDDRKHSNTLYGSFRFPETYVIDSRGILRRKFIGPVDWTKPEIIEYLKNL